MLLIIPAEFHMPLLFIIAYILGLNGTLFSVGLNSQLIYFVGAAHLGKVNVWITSLSSIGMVIGSLMAGGVIATLGYSAVFMLNVGTYVFSALLIGTVRMPKQENLTGYSPSSHKKGWRDLQKGLKQYPVLKAMLVATLADTLGSASHNIGYPIFSNQFVGDDPARTMGYMIAVWAVGKLVGAKLSKYPVG